MLIDPRKVFMKAILVTACFSLVSACNRSRIVVPDVHLPFQELAKDLLANYVLSYCWQYPDGRVVETLPEDKEIVIVVSTGDSTSKEIIRNEFNLRDDTPAFFIYKSGCVAKGNDIRYIGNVLTWQPDQNMLTFTFGSNPYLTDFENYEVGDDLHASKQDFPLRRKEYGGLFSEPRGIYWSPDGQQFATLGIDVGLESSGANIWVYDLNDRNIVKITPYKDIGEYVVNANWSQNGKFLAVGYGKDGGVGIVEFDNSKLYDFSYKAITSKTNSQLREWPYYYADSFNLILRKDDALFTSYLYTISQPVWMDNDQQIIFVAPDEKQASALFVVKSDGTGLEKLLPQLSGNIFLPKLSPNGDVLAFVRYPNWRDRTRAEIGVINLFTKEIQSLLVMPAPEDGNELLVSGMAWSADGQYLAFSSNSFGESDIYVLSSDGENWLNLTEEIPGNAVAPVWKP